jgi:hypothetical protein
MRSAHHFVALVLAVLLAAPVSARAQSDGQGGSFLNPFPAGDFYKVLAVGDDLADGLLYGLIEAFAGDTRLDIVKRHHVLSGITRNDFDDRLLGLDELLAREPANIAVVMLGAWDRNPLRAQNGKRAPVGSQEWRAEYASRVDRVMKTLKKKGVAVYWVGLPNVRKPDADEDAKMMNEIIREKVYINGHKYVDAYANFIDEQGGFSAYGPDETGKMRLLREGDGVYFTSAGNRKLAFYVEREIKRDLTQAKSERNIPLAGSEAEQVKIRPEKAAAAEGASAPAPGTKSSTVPDGPAPAASAAGMPAGDAAPWTSVMTPAPRPAAPPPAATDQKADNGKISLKLVNQSGREEVVTLDVVRPAIPASVVALVTRRESPDKPTQMGEQLVDQITGGLTVMSSVTPSSTATAARGGGRRLSPTQSAYYRVLMKGERLAPRPGRADDFSWPRPDAQVVRASAPGAPSVAKPAQPAAQGAPSGQRSAPGGAPGSAGGTGQITP